MPSKKKKKKEEGQKKKSMRILLVENTPLVFNLEDVRLLREHGVVGVLSGTLPSLSQQNVFLSVPLRLMLEELLWLLWDSPLHVEVIRSGLPWFSHHIPDGHRHSRQAAQTTQESLDGQRQQRRENHAKKLRHLGVEPQPEDAGLLEASLFLQTRDSAENRIGEQDSADVQPTANQLRCYRLYRELRRLGFSVHPGGRFGGRYVVYPGDPLRFHSHVVVGEPLAADEPLDLLQMVAGARLATTVKKSYVASCVGGSAAAEPSFYSFEWAGFG